MADDPKTPRGTWKQTEVLKLADTYREHGFRGVVGAYPGRTEAELASKLESLGLLSLPAGERSAILNFIINVEKSEHPSLFIKHAIAELRKAGGK